MRYICSVSHGKDSQAMLLEIIARGLPLDEVIYYDNGMDFAAITRLSEQTEIFCENHGIIYTRLRPEQPFEYDMLSKPVVSKQKGSHNGYGWCGGVCRWGTALKVTTLDRYTKSLGEHKTYIGIAADERERIAKERKPSVVLPLVDFGMSESDCLSRCRESNITWLEESPVTESGYVDLYEILDRVSCWCCCNKNRKELKNMWKYLPQYWAKLEHLQSCLDRPMKNFVCKGVSYGNVFDMAKVFKEEDEDYE